MKDGMEHIKELINMYDFPLEALQTIRVRLGDWFVSGGKPTDGYVWQQARYLENLVRYGLAREKELKQKMINEVLHSRLIAFALGAWMVYCGSIGAYDGALFIPMIYASLLLLNHMDQKKSDGAGNADAHK